MRPDRTAANMIARYGDDAGIHCVYAIMNNEENPRALRFWREVSKEIQRQLKERP